MHLLVLAWCISICTVPNWHVFQNTSTRSLDLFFLFGRKALDLDRLIKLEHQFEEGKSKHIRNAFRLEFILIKNKSADLKKYIHTKPSRFTFLQGTGWNYSFYVDRKMTTSNKNLILSVNMKTQVSPSFKSLSCTNVAQPLWIVVLPEA